ncbi:MAG: ABC transporter permease [Candidatus Zixiibacteriota bacterium]
MFLTAVEIKDSILMALASIRANKFRAGLTILGVMVGVSSVIGMAAIIDGLNGAAEAEIDRIGSNVILVQRFEEGVDYDRLTDEERNRPPITVGEARAIKDHCPSIDGVSPQNFYFKPGGNEVKYKNIKFSDPYIFGTWPDFVRVRNREMAEGRFLSEVDEQHRLNVCVLGADVAETLFEGVPATGKEIRVNGYNFEVIGVVEKQQSNFGDNSDNRLVIIPLSTFSKMYPWEEALGLLVRAVSRERIEQAKEEITTALRIYRKVPFNKKDNFALQTQEQFKEEVNNITKYIYIAMIIITSVGLMVGGIGVMNIMLVSVTERTREIGVRKAIGAKRSNIILQFLTEAMSLSATGGVIGVIFGMSVGMLINMLLDFPITVPFFWVVIGFIVSVSVGLISGVYPAIKASRLDPIEALRYE